MILSLYFSLSLFPFLPLLFVHYIFISRAVSSEHWNASWFSYRCWIQWDSTSSACTWGSIATGTPSKCCGIKMGIPLLPQRAGSKSLCRVVISFLKTQTPQQSLLTPIPSCTKTLTTLLGTSHKGRLETLVLKQENSAVLRNTGATWCRCMLVGPRIPLNICCK
jgi:hypothetical protein